MTSRTPSPVLLRERKNWNREIVQCFIHHQVERDRKRERETGEILINGYFSYIEREGDGRTDLETLNRMFRNRTVIHSWIFHRFKNKRN